MKSVICLPFLLAAVQTQAQLPLVSGGVLRPEQAVFDVQSYDVTLGVDPSQKTITGTTVMNAKVTTPTNAILLDLDVPYTVSQVSDANGLPLKFERTSDAIRIWFPQTYQAGGTFRTSVTYSGAPRVAKRAPWDGGFVWSKAGDDPWVSVALQGEGADLLFPCKDHPSDKPNTAAMHITVPDPLIAVGPGKFEGSKHHSDGTSTFNWRMGVPIANYSIVFNAAPYQLIEDTAKSIDGSTVPIKLYILPADAPKGQRLIDETKKYLAFMEKYCGPYAFRTQKLGIVQTPHLGMEHSTAIAYGNRFRFAPDGLDWLMLHEFGHEWWANLVTASDWRDFWLHEGFQSYMDSLYQEETHGRYAYFRSMRGRRRGIKNIQPVAPREPKASYEVYLDGPDYKEYDGDIYDKGALILHALRYLVGDDAFFKALRHMAYPTKAMERVTDGRQERLVTTDDFLAIAERDSGMKLDWFFELYLRQAKLPRLVTAIEGNVMTLQWETPGDLPFPMPVEVIVDGHRQRVTFQDGKASVPFSGAPPLVDPDGWVLREE